MILLDRYLKKAQISDFEKIRLVGAELFHVGERTDRQTDGHDEANSHFSKFTNAPKDDGTKIRVAS